MPIDLTGNWRSFVKDQRTGLWKIRKDKYYITHKNTNIYVFGSCNFVSQIWRMWSNVGVATNLKNDELAEFVVTWCDRSDSEGDGLDNTHEYKLRIINENLIVQIDNQNEDFSFGNWIRKTDVIDQTTQELIEQHYKVV